MKLLDDFAASLKFWAFSVVVCSIIYPAVLWGYAHAFFPEQSEGSLLRSKDGTIIGSKLLSQRFSEPRYFWSRPSAADHNAAAAGGSNLSRSNPALTERMEKTRQGYLAYGPSGDVPADLLAASGSGLDPVISREAALFQAPRVAQARKVEPDRVYELITRMSYAPGFAAARVINVLELNLAVDAIAQAE